MTLWVPEIASRPGPRYIAIAEAIAEAVATGDLAPGARLPTHRDLARALGVTVGTVTRAYAEAIRRDLVVGEVGRGSFVKPARPGEKVAPIPKDPRVCDFAVNLPAEGGDEDEVRRALSELAADEALMGLMGYPSDSDLLRPGRILARWAESQGAPYAPERLAITSGAQNGLIAALMAVCHAGDTLLCDELTYPGMKNLARMLGIRLHGVAMDEGGMTVAALDSAMAHQAPRAVYCVPNYQNPTGTIWSRDRREALAAFAMRRGVWIIEDDVYGFLAEDSERLPPLAALAPERTIYVNSASKAMAPGLRVGLVLAPAEILGAVSAGVRLSTMAPSPLTLEIAVRWIDSGHAAAASRWHRTEARARRAIALRALAGFRVSGDQGSYHLWLNLPEPWRSDEFASAAARAGVIVSAADHFLVGQRASAAAVRLCLGGAKPRAKVEEGLTRLADLLSGDALPAYSSMP